MALSSSQKLLLQPYPREGQTLLSANSLFPRKSPAISIQELEEIVDLAFQRCFKNKKGDIKVLNETPQSIVASTIKHLKAKKRPDFKSLFSWTIKSRRYF